MLFTRLLRAPSANNRNLVRVTLLLAALFVLVVFAFGCSSTAAYKTAEEYYDAEACDEMYAPEVEVLAAAPLMWVSNVGYQPTLADMKVYEKLTQDLMWYYHIPRAMVDFKLDGVKQFWVLRGLCPYDRLQFECDSSSHVWGAGTRGKEDPRAFLGKVDAPCGTGYLVILSDEAVKYLEWLSKHNASDYARVLAGGDY